MNLMYSHTYVTSRGEERVCRKVGNRVYVQSRTEVPVPVRGDVVRIRKPADHWFQFRYIVLAVEDLRDATVLHIVRHHG